MARKNIDEWIDDDEKEEILHVGDVFAEEAAV